MVQDVILKRDDDGLFDLTIVDQDFGAVTGFETAMMVSLFTDSRASPADVLTPERRRGWVGDILTSSIGRALGSTLWIFEQARITQEILNQVAIAAQDSLNWMIEDGIARDVNATVEKNAKRGIVVNIEIVTLEGKNQRYAVLWRSTSNV